MTGPRQFSDFTLLSSTNLFLQLCLSKAKAFKSPDLLFVWEKQTNEKIGGGHGN